MAGALISEEIRYADGSVASDRLVKVVTRDAAVGSTAVPVYPSPGLVKLGVERDKNDGKAADAAGLTLEEWTLLNPPADVIPQPMLTSSTGRIQCFVQAGTRVDLLLLDATGTVEEGRLALEPQSNRAAAMDRVVLLTYGTGWAPYSSTSYITYLRTQSGLVVIEGMTAAQSTTPSNTVFTLPVGYRPSIDVSFITVMQAGALFGYNPTSVTVSASTGAVTTVAGTRQVGDFLSLAGISFRAA